MSALPPNAEGSVFTATGSTIIDAPAQTIWEILLDSPSYPEWNSFVCVTSESLLHYSSADERIHAPSGLSSRRSQVVVNALDLPHRDQRVKEGSFLQLRTNIPPSMSKPAWFTLPARLAVTYFDPENYRMGWTNRLPKWLMTAERWQWLTPLEGGKTKYEGIEVFNGFLAYFVKWFVGSGLKDGFQAMADNLKTRAEQQTE